MTSTNTVTVDFIARGTTPDEWRMVLVEGGPWKGAIEDHLRVLQDRLYGCIDAPLAGDLAEKFPESRGKRLLIQGDCYDVPREEVNSFFEKFSAGVFETADYRGVATKSAYVRGIEFAITFDLIH